MYSVKFTFRKLLMLILTKYVTTILYEVLFAGHEHMEPCNIWCLTLLCCIQLSGHSPMNFCTSSFISVVPAKQLMNALNLKCSVQILYAMSLLQLTCSLKYIALHNNEITAASLGHKFLIAQITLQPQTICGCMI